MLLTRNLMHCHFVNQKKMIRKSREMGYLNTPQNNPEIELLCAISKLKKGVGFDYT